MARLSKEERDELLARLADDHDDEPDTDPDDDTDTVEEDDTDTDDTEEADSGDYDVLADTGNGEIMVLRGAAADRLLEQYLGTPSKKPATKATRAAKKTTATKTAKATTPVRKRAPRTQPDPEPKKSGHGYFR